MAYVKPNTISGEITASPHNTNYDYIINALNSYDGSNIAALSVPSTAIAASAITAAKLASNAVETAKIKDENVTAAKLADDSVSARTLKDGAVYVARANITGWDIEEDEAKSEEDWDISAIVPSNTIAVEVGISIKDTSSNSKTASVTTPDAPAGSLGSNGITLTTKADDSNAYHNFGIVNMKADGSAGQSLKYSCSATSNYTRFVIKGYYIQGEAT